ncbi:MAG: ACP S-malonyltransferase [Succinatimonas sp.]|nr:ACP S-malonyltransferase [Succinatimonas sp.]
MKKFAAVFPGQGSQSVGMFASFMDNSVVASVYEEASDALGYDLKKVTLEGPESELNRTEVTQPAILTASVAAFRAFSAKCDGMPVCMAGHSLGEYSALVCAGALEFSDAVRLVRLRGQAMQDAVPQGEGAMAAVLGLDDDVIVKACEEISAEGNKVWAANFNTPGQVVVSGTAQGVAKVSEALTAAGARRVVPLAVSAPSHCPLMQSAADKLSEALSNLKISDAKIPVYSNAYAKPETKASEITDALVRQLVGPVRWVETVLGMKNSGVEILVEMGPNRVLSGMLRRIDRSLIATNVGDPESLAKTMEALN